MTIVDRSVPHVVDTSAWIEWWLDSPTGRRLGVHFPEPRRCFVPTIVQLELATWLTRELGEDRAEQVLAYTMKCVVVPLDTAPALRAADGREAHRLAAADAIVDATAQQAGVPLLTCDARFRRLADVVSIEKPA